MNENIIYCEVDFFNGTERTSTCIKATRIPTRDEAEEFLRKDVEQFGNVSCVVEISEEEARKFYDFSENDKKPTFTGNFIDCVRAEIYKHRGQDCSNKGLSSKFDEVYVPAKDGNWKISLDNPPDNLLRIVRRKIFGRDYVHVEPWDTKGKWVMAGGTFVDSCDARFREAIDNGGYPVSLHDRTEP